MGGDSRGRGFEAGVKDFDYGQQAKQIALILFDWEERKKYTDFFKKGPFPAYYSFSSFQYLQLTECR